jgi:hypothetical protein
MEWTFIYLMVVLKLPIFALFGIIWWAVRTTDEAEAEPPEPEGGNDDGGSKRPLHPRPGPRPRKPRRGPHGDPPASPKRTRTTVVRARRLSER